MALPAKFPNKVVSNTAWVGRDLEDKAVQSQYTLVLNEAHILEIEQACREFSGEFFQCLQWVFEKT